MNNYAAPLQPPINLNSWMVDLGCIPCLNDCIPTPTGLLFDCDDLYNCNLCSVDKFYAMPYTPGNTFMIQSQFFDTINPTPETPTLGLNEFVFVDVLDACTNEILNVSNYVSASQVAYAEGVGSYQNFVIDTGNILVDVCWYLKVRTADGQELCTPAFKACINPCDSGETITIEGDFKSSDCEGNYYGEADAFVGDELTYSNKIELKAKISKALPSTTTEFYANKAIKTTRTDNYTFTLLQPIGSNTQCYLNNLFSAGNILIDGVEYSNESFAPANLIANGGNMYLWNTQLTKTCEADLIC